MRGEQYKQMYCVQETNGALFELKMNEILKTVKNPEIEIDRNRSFTAYIFYENTIDVPETFTELIELISGERHTCQDCEHLIKSPDKRKRWQVCSFYNKKVRQNAPACKTFYLKIISSNLLEDPDRLPAEVKKELIK